MANPNQIAANANAGIANPDTPTTNNVINAWGAFQDMVGVTLPDTAQAIQSYADYVAQLSF